MNLTFCAMGDINEIQPFITMANYFNTAGNKITVVCNSDYKYITDQYDLNFVPLPIMFQDVIDNGFSNMDVITNTKKYVNKFREEIVSSFPILIDATKDSDIVFYNTSICGIEDISIQYNFEIIKVSSLPYFYPTKKLKNKSKSSFLTTISKKSHNLSVEKNVIDIINNHRQYYFGKNPRLMNIYNYQIDNKKIKHILANSKYMFEEDLYDDDNVLVPGFLTFPTLKTLNPEIISYLNDYPRPILYDRRYSNVKDEEEFFKALKKVDDQLDSGVIIVGNVDAKYVKKFPKIFFTSDVPIKLIASYAHVYIHNGGLNSYVNGFEAKCPSVAMPKSEEEKFYTNMFLEKDLCLKPIKASGMYLKKLLDSLSDIDDSKLQIEIEKIHDAIYEEDTLNNISNFIKQ